MTILKQASVLTVGYWNNYRNEYPMYKLPPKPNTANYDVPQVLKYLKGCERMAHTWGHSACRICGQSAGTTAATDSILRFPSGLIHYVEVHKIALPDYVIEHIGDKEVAEELDYDQYVNAARDSKDYWTEWINANGIELEKDIDKYLDVASEKDKEAYNRMLNRDYPYVHRKSRHGLTEEEAIKEGYGRTLETDKPKWDNRIKHRYGPLVHYGISEKMGEMMY